MVKKGDHLDHKLFKELFVVTYILLMHGLVGMSYSAIKGVGFEFHLS